MDRTAPPPIPQFSSRPPAAVPVDNATMALPSSSPLPSMSLSLTSPRHTDSGSRPVSGPGPARHTDPSSTRNLAEEPSNPPTTPRRWHHRLAPRVERHSPTNALPWPFGGWVHPTHVEFRLPGPGGVHLGRGLVHRRSWRSRQHRKGRYIGTSPKGRARRVEAMVKRKGGIRGKWRRLILKIGRMRMVEYWNISWWVAVVRLSFFFFFCAHKFNCLPTHLQVFTLGSTIWVLNGFVVFLPLLLPSRFAEGPSFGSWTAWAGATVFEIGAALAMWEAWNRADTADFGWNVRELWEKGLDAAEEHPPSRAHADKGDRTGLPAPLPLPPPPSSRNEEEGLRWSSTSTASREKNEPGFDGVDRDRLCGEKQKWVWFSTDTKYWHELGFLAAFSQFCGATIFWISG